MQLARFAVEPAHDQLPLTVGKTGYAAWEPGRKSLFALGKRQRAQRLPFPLLRPAREIRAGAVIRRGGESDEGGCRGQQQGEQV
jgi:hypothetical protein